MCKLVPKIGLMVTANPFEEGAEEAGKLKCGIERKLEGLELLVASAPGIVKDRYTMEKAAAAFISADIDVICLVEATWSNDDFLLDLLELIERPVIVWGIPDVTAGSVCGGQQVCCVLFELGKKYKFLHGNIESPTLFSELYDYAMAAALAKNMRRTRFVMMDYRVPGMTEIAFDELSLKSQFGPRVIQLPFDIFAAKAATVKSSRIKEVKQNIEGRYGRCLASSRDLDESVRKYIALKDYLEEEGAEGVSFRCYPDHMGEICLAFSLLSDHGIVCGCEGDINAVAAMYMLSRLTGLAVHNTDFLYVYEDINAGLYAHCGAAGFSLAGGKDDISLEPVRLANKGLCVLFPAHPGKVTMLNLVGRNATYRLGILTGEAIKTGMDFAGNPVKVMLDIPYGRVLEQTAEMGMGHHWMITYGDVVKQVEYFCSMIGLKYYKF